MAEEIRGQGLVNTTSALENAETSAIGRALASLGLAGGEYASANELDAVERKTQAMSSLLFDSLRFRHLNTIMILSIQNLPKEN